MNLDIPDNKDKNLWDNLFLSRNKTKMDPSSLNFGPNGFAYNASMFSLNI